MDAREKKEFGALYARLDDLLKRAERAELSISAFLSMRELHYAGKYLKTQGADFFDFGGYEDAERRRIYILPEYMALTNEIKANDISDYLKTWGFDADISVLRIIGSGYRKLTHRDFLGSLLGLGLDRSVIGDIAVEDEEGKSALVFCESKISYFIESEMKKAASDTVRVVRLNDGEWHIPERRFAMLHDTVASPRLDCAVAALCSVSREKARETVCGGLVEIDFESEDRPDRTVTAPSLISVRGFGRYRIVALSERTKKGRYRMEAEKFL